MSTQNLYLAAALDTAGSIYFEPSNYRVTVYLYSKQRPLLEQFQARWGGSISGNRWKCSSTRNVRSLLDMWSDHTQCRAKEIQEMTYRLPKPRL